MNRRLPCGPLSAAALLLTAATAAPAAGQVDLALEGSWGRDGGSSRMFAVGADLRVPLGLSANAELSYWGEPGTACVPESPRCEVEGWVGTIGARFRPPFLPGSPLRPYVGAAVGSYIDPPTPGGAESPSVWSAEGGVAVGLGKLEITVVYRHMSADDARHEELFDEGLDYGVFVVRLGWVML